MTTSDYSKCTSAGGQSPIMDNSSDDEVFIGKITSRERIRPSFNSRRRTTLYFPGISRPDGSVNVYKEVTDDGTLFFSCENMEQTGVSHCAAAVDEVTSPPAITQTLNSTMVTLTRSYQAQPTALKSTNFSAFTSGFVEDHLQLGSTSASRSVSSRASDADSGFSSVSDQGSMSGDAYSPLPLSASYSGFPVVPDLKGLSALDDRKRKRCQMSSSESDTKTFPVRSSVLLVSPESIGMHNNNTHSPVIKRHIACTGAPSPASGNVAAQLQNDETETAFSKLNLVSKPAITKDFPNIIAHESPAAEHHITPESHQGNALVNRKIAQKLSCCELQELEKELQNIVQNDKKNVSAVPTPLAMPVDMPGPACDVAGGVFDTNPTSRPITPIHVLQHIHQIGSDHCSVSEQIACTLSTADPVTISPGGDAHFIKHFVSKDSIFVPETPDVKSSTFLPSGLRWSQQLNDEEDEYETVPSSQRMVSEAPADSTNLNGRLSLLSGDVNTLSTCTSSPSQSTPLFTQFSDQSPSVSPDLFSSPCFDKLSVSESTDAFVHSPIPGSGICVANSVKSLSKCLQPIKEDSSESLEVSASITEQLTKLVSVSVSVGVNQERKKSRTRCRRPKYPPLKKCTPGSGNKENIGQGAEPLSNFIYPSPVYAHRYSSATSDSLAQSWDSKERRQDGDPSDTPGSAESGPEVSHSQSQQPHYQGMTVAHIQECLTNGRRSFNEDPVPPRIAIQGTSTGVRLLHPVPSEEQLEEDSRAAMTRINTMINAETRHSMLDPESSPALLTEYPPPKEATRISWRDTLAEDPAAPLSPLVSAATPRSILQQRADYHEFPFSKDPPSPIILTRKRTLKWPRLLTFNN